ncbi:hypothetical protein HCBG_05520 [Histoplasma capsulatum G186AR]|uniref:Uncharacterized protein n=1 Tax=Ajellomyces capsulatus (strain G186AR / H82 / ATCC MYA-2454 / RMSCC 2432) TaxID=447093 RepID=C0NR90_AJECG|nr:uncharacterized protein HCBG_05520 [Histoplasma capsulatum G186AR]EEH06204.1 hypothetical protein HCBG_05520 [Histoplasma capsulatum G186AR]
MAKMKFEASNIGVRNKKSGLEENRSSTAQSNRKNHEYLQHRNRYMFHIIIESHGQSSNAFQENLRKPESKRSTVKRVAYAVASDIESGKAKDSPVVLKGGSVWRLD